MKRRDFLGAAAALGASSVWLPSRRARAAGAGRVVIVGGGWGGLSAARYVREFAPQLEVTLLERQTRFWSAPLSNRWLVGQLDGALLAHDYRAAARHWGYRFVPAEATGIDRDKRHVVAATERFPYDWLVLALGIRHDYSAWFGEDKEAIADTRRRYPAAFTAGDEYAFLREKLLGFAGGELLMTIPPQPFRCPPAPYERAVMIAGWLERRGIPGRLTVLDANPPFQEFQRIFRDRFPRRIDYRSQVAVKTVDPQRRIVDTEFDSFGFDEAILMPPQQAADLAWQADLVGRDAGGKPTGWVAVDPLGYATAADPRIYCVGDMIDRVSPLFGHYPKSGQMASRQGRIAACRIAAEAAGKPAPHELPDSVCHIATQYDPPASLRIDAAYRLRGDGALVQQTQIRRDPQPRDEDLAWAQGMFREFLAPPH